MGCMSKTKLFVYVLAVAALVFFVGRTVPFGTKTLEVRFEETNLSVTFERSKFLILASSPAQKYTAFI